MPIGSNAIKVVLNQKITPKILYICMPPMGGPMGGSITNVRLICLFNNIIKSRLICPAPYRLNPPISKPPSTFSRENIDGKYF